MKTETAAPVATETIVAATAKLQKTSTITLTAADGSTMQCIAERKGDGARTYIITTDSDKKTARGMTENHPSFDAAKAATEKIAAKAVKLGWQRREARRSFVAKPDAFSSIPAAPKVKK